MAVRMLHPPKKVRRRGQPALSARDHKAVVKALNEGGHPGPEDSFGDMRAARRMIQRWAREVQPEFPSHRVGTRVWPDPENEGQYLAALRLIEIVPSEGVSE